MIDYSLYLVTDRKCLQGKDFLKSIEEAIKGGVSVVQLREKELEFEEFLHVAKSLKKLTDFYNVPLIINDNVKIAHMIDCTGVHVGQDDESLQRAREILGNKKIIGVSVRDEKEAFNAFKGGADYLGVGAVFFTPTKKDIKTPIGLDGLEKIVCTCNIPSVAIGGIDLQNLKEVLNTHVSGVAVISALLKSEDIQKTAHQFQKIIKENKCKK